MGRSPEPAAAAIRQAQRGLARSISPLVEGTLFGGYRLNHAMFNAFSSLMDSGGAPAPHPLAVVHREADDRVFVYE